MWPSVALLAFVTLQRLVELPVANANTRRLLAAGGHEVDDDLRAREYDGFLGRTAYRAG